MAVLLTGGTGKTSVAIAHLLQDAKIPFLLASRRGQSAAPSGMPATTFDWLDSSTFAKAFEHKFPGGESIQAVYLIAPGVPEPAAPMNAFIDIAIKEHGVKRFVVLGGSSVEVGGAHVGGVWQHLLDSHVEYCVLRPTWFMENFIEGGHLFSIKGESKIYTACGDGKVPFIGVTDIAAVAFRALTDEKPHNTDYRVLGPELLTHDQIAEKISSASGCKVENVKLTEDERLKQYLGAGLPDFYANLLTSLETITATGAEERTNDVIEQVTGRPGQTFDAFAQENKAAWQ